MAMTWKHQQKKEMQMQCKGQQLCEQGPSSAVSGKCKLRSQEKLVYTQQKS